MEQHQVKPIYHIPANVFKIFEKISKQNKCPEFRHLETLGFLIGSKNSQNEIRISGLLFPDQKCCAYSVDSLDLINGREMTEEIEALFGINKQILGWVHTHTRGVPCFFSSFDVHTQFNYQLSCSEFIGIVLELTEEDFVINKEYYKLTDEGMNHVQSCIVINQNKTLNHQHEFCNSDKLYQSINKENVFLVDETLNIHIAAQFEHFEQTTEQNDAVSAVDVFEDVFACPELLLEATKFDDSNVSHAGSPNQPRTPKRPRGVSDAAGNAMNGIGRGKRRFYTDENYNLYDAIDTIDTITEDLNEMKIKIKSCPKTRTKNYRVSHIETYFMN